MQQKTLTKLKISQTVVYVEILAMIGLKKFFALLR